MKLCTDDGAVILTFKLTENEAMHIANVLNKKRDANGYNLYRLDWTDDRDFRTQAEKDFDRLCSVVDLSVGSVKLYKRNNLNDIANYQMNEATLLLDQAANLIKEAHRKLL